MAKTPKPSCRGSVSGSPCQTAWVGGGWRWWRGRYKAIAALGQSVRKREAGGGVECQKPRNRAAVARFRGCHAKRQR